MKFRGKVKMWTGRVMVVLFAAVVILSAPPGALRALLSALAVFMVSGST